MNEDAKTRRAVRARLLTKHKQINMQQHEELVYNSVLSAVHLRTLVWPAQ